MLTPSQKKSNDQGTRGTNRSSPDEAVNREIIALLQLDGRMAFSEIAERLGVSEGTVRNRVAAMKEAEALRIVAIADPATAQYDTIAMLGIKVAPETTPTGVAERLKRCSEVVYILWVGGRFDLLVEVVTDDHDRFLEFLEREIHASADIATVETMTALKNFKNQFLLKSKWEAQDD